MRTTTPRGRWGRGRARPSWLPRARLRAITAGAARRAERVEQLAWAFRSGDYDAAAYDAGAEAGSGIRALSALHAPRAQSRSQRAQRRFPHRHPPAMGPRKGRDGPPRSPPRGRLRAREVAVVPHPGSSGLFGRASRRREAEEEGRAVLPLAVVEQLVDEALAPASAVDEDVLERDEPLQVDRQPASSLQPVARRTSRRVKRRSLRSTPCFAATPRDHRRRGARGAAASAAAARRALRPRTSEARRLARAMSARVGPRCTRFVLAVAGLGFHRPLVLVEERDRLDEGEVLDVVAPGPRLLVEEGQLAA